MVRNVALTFTAYILPSPEYVALYTYESPEVGDLTFVEGDVVIVTEREGEWWRGCIGDQTGVFPSNYVRPVEPEVSPVCLWVNVCQNRSTVYCYAQSLSANFPFRQQNLELQPKSLVRHTHKHTLRHTKSVPYTADYLCGRSTFISSRICLANRNCPGCHQHHRRHSKHASAAFVSRATDRGPGKELHRLVARGTAGNRRRVEDASCSIFVHVITRLYLVPVSSRLIAPYKIQSSHWQSEAAPSVLVELAVNGSTM